MGSHLLPEPLLQSRPLLRTASPRSVGAENPNKTLKKLLVPRRSQCSSGQGVTAPNSPAAPFVSRLVPHEDRRPQGSWLAGRRRSRTVSH